MLSDNFTLKGLLIILECFFGNSIIAVPLRRTRPIAECRRLFRCYGSETSGDLADVVGCGLFTRLS